MRTSRILLFALATLATFGACSPYDPTLSGSPFLCGSDDPQCPDGFTCMSNGTANVCVSSGGGGMVDGGTFQCADDHMLEPNDTTATAFQTPVASSRPTISLAGLAICPAGDKDLYKIDITVEGQNLQVDVIFDPGTPLALSILNNQAVPIVTGTALGMTTTAKVANLPMASSPYYAQVTGPAGGQNNYKLNIAVTGP
jgi:hypothetical protein